MSKPRVLLTRMLPPEVMRVLEERCELSANREDRVLSKAELIDAATGMDGLICLLTDRIDADILDIQPKLKVVSVYAVGYNNVDIPAATARGIPVTNTPGVLTETTADLAWALLMAVARRTVEADRYTRAGSFTLWEPMLLLGSDVYGKTLGLIGAGRIGQAVARRARGFNMRVLYSNIRELPADIVRSLDLERVSLDDLLRQADFVSLHAPLTPDTHHLIGAAQLARMKRGAYLINTARGALVDEAALVAALRAGHLGGAGLDVFEHEPALAPGLTDLENVVLAPHIGSASLETRTKMGLMAVDNVLEVLERGRSSHTVNPEVYG